MFQKRKKSFLASSGNALRDVEVSIFTRTIGLLGRVFGRDLKFTVDHFQFEVQEGEVKRAHFLSDSVKAVSEIYYTTKLDRAFLTDLEIKKLQQRVKDHVLKAQHFSVIDFEVEKVEPGFVAGQLSLCGEKKSIVCTTAKRNSKIYVTCPVNQQDFGIKPYSTLFGLFRVHPVVEVGLEIPERVL